MPSLQHLREEPPLRRGGEVRFPLSQRNPLQPAVLCLRLVVQRRLLSGEKIDFNIELQQTLHLNCRIQAQDLYYINDAFNEALAANSKP